MKKHLLTLLCIIGISATFLTGCSTQKTHETNTAKAITGRVSNVSSSSFSLSPSSDNPEHKYASSLKVSAGSITDSQTKDLIKTLKNDDIVTIFFYDEISPINKSNIKELYRVEVENSAGAMCYGTTQNVPPAAMIGGVLYTDTGIVTKNTPDNDKSMGSINASVAEHTLPQGNSECNFGKGHVFWKIGKNTAIIKVGEEFKIFKKNAANLEKAQQIRIYKGRGNGNFENYKTPVEAVNDYVIIREMRANGILPDDVMITKIKFDTKDAFTMEIDFNKNFANYLFEVGQQGEYEARGAIVNTLLDAYEMKRVRITIDGEWYKTEDCEDAIYTFHGTRPVN